ncbi:MAG: PP2C-family Ser/Thr phosphatase [Puniceicoccaceae bacterium MED-G32]|nr:MAG: PP2C-family Ser/Thr phosphatase [Puniceicoccaceae bacterium MED-G32]
MSEERKILKWSAHTDVGRFRSNNEDSFLALQVNGEGVFRLGKWGEAEIGTSDFVFAVSDGMGGANAGEYASHLVAEQMTQLFPKVFQTQAQGMTVYFQDVLNELVTNVHSSLSDMGECYSELEGMGATLSLCWVRSDRLYFAHVGDSRIYHLSKTGSFNQLSKDHTHIAWLKEKGEISDYEARNDPRRNILHQVIGGKTQRLNPQFGELVFESKDRLLICSDGLIEGLMDSALKRMLNFSNPIYEVKSEGVAQAMVDESVREDGKDNTTALCFEVLDAN